MDTLHLTRTLAACALALACALPAPVQASVSCEINGKNVNTSNGTVMAQFSGLMRCKYDSSGKPQRDEEIRNGKNIGLQRLYDYNGQVERERNVNERGNAHGRSRFFWPGGQVKREELFNDGTLEGVVREFDKNGQPSRVAYAYQGQDEADLEYNPNGSLRAMRCAARSLLPEDKTPCGFGPGPVQTNLYNDKNQRIATRSYHQGKLLASTSYRPDGGVERELAFLEGRRLHRNYALHDGKNVLREERLFEADNAPLDTSRAPLVHSKTWGSNGVLTEHKRYTKGEESLIERWYLNGAKKERTAIERVADGSVRERDNAGRLQHAFYDDEGRLTQNETRTLRGYLTGVQTRYHANGKTYAETRYSAPNESGATRRVAYKEWDESGALVADEQILEDGSRVRKP